VAEQLKDQGRFIMTCFDGRDVLKLTDGDVWDANEYYIRVCKKSKQLKPYGQKIDVKLPFSKEEYYTEFLVDIDYIEQEFAKRDIILEKDVSFSEYLPNYKDAHLLSTAEKQYVGLYHYYAFYKNTQHLNDAQHRIVAKRKERLSKRR
jgi:hypothetical protein